MCRNVKDMPTPVASSPKADLFCVHVRLPDDKVYAADDIFSLVDWIHQHANSLNSNHPITALGDHLGALKAVADELGIPFECTDHMTPDEIEAG